MTAPDFQQIKQLFATVWDLSNSDRVAEKAGTEVEQLLPRALFSKLSQLEDVDHPAFEQTFRDFYTEPVTTDAGEEPTEATTEELDLLPFEVYVKRLDRCVPADGYKIDQWERVHGTGGRRRKQGPLGRIRKWKRRKNSKPVFVWGCKLTLRGHRESITGKSLALARFNAERKRDGAEDEL